MLPVWTFDDAVARIRPHLWRYLSAHSKRVDLGALVEDVWQLPTGDFERLAATHIGVHPSTRAMLDVAGDVLRRLPSSVARREEELRAEVRGPIAWAQTMQRRATTADPTLFVCRPTERRYDTPIGRIVKLALSECSRLAVRSQLPDAGEVGKAVWRIAHDAQRLLQSPKLGGVRLVQHTPAEILDQVERRRPQLQPVIDFVRLIRAAFEEKDEFVVRSILETQLLPPADPARLFELEVGFCVMDRFMSHGYELSAGAGLLRHPRPFASLVHPDSRHITMWWQRSVWVVPDAPPRQGLYRRTLGDAQIRPPTPLRPDFVMLFEPGSHIVAVEVKLTEDRPSADERGGVSEMLAYLLDAAALFGGGETPQGLVVAWNASGRPALSRILVTDQRHVPDAIDLIVGALSP